jgi:cytochrome c oxidase subunit IV
MANQHHSAPQQESARSHHEGPRNHYVAFALSIVLTILAFAAVNANLGKTFTLSFIVLLAIIQAAFQLFVWMHMKDKGHFYAKISIAFGAFIAFTALVSAVYWMWW